MIFDAPSNRTRRSDISVRWMVALAYLVSAALPLGWLDRNAPVLCPFRLITGLPCPACGMTHAFIALAHGHLHAAWRYNALSLPLFLLGLGWLAGEATGRRPRLGRRASRWAAGLGLAVMLLYGAYRILVPAARPF